MIKIMVVTNSDKWDVIKSEDTTPRQIFDEFGVNYGVSVVNLNGRRLTGSDLDISFADLGVSEDCYLTSVVKADNAVEVRIEGPAAIITSSMKREDIVLAKKYRPDSLLIYEGEGRDRKAVFGVDYNNNTGHMNKYGATFGGKTNAEGNAMIVMIFGEDKKPAEEVEENYGRELLSIEKIEATMANILADIHAEQTAIRNKITVA